MTKKFSFLVMILLAANFVTAQTTGEKYKEVIAEKKAQIAEKEKEIEKLQGEVGALKGEIEALPGWDYGTFGTIGVNFSDYNNWFSQANPNAASTSIGFVLNGFANYDEAKYLWRNNATLNLGWLDVQEDASWSLSDLEQVSDVLNVSSLFGYKLTDKFAISALGEYRTAVIGKEAPEDGGASKFNNPGYLDFGVGGTYTPNSKMVVVVHPINYNIVFSKRSDDVFQSSLGAKFVVDYKDKVAKYINWRSNFSGFLSYKSTDLSNWTWVNSFGFTAFKGIGVGFDLGLRSNKQESLESAVKSTALPVGDPNYPSFDNIDNVIQTYWLLGLSFAF